MRYAALSSVLLLRRHAGTHRALESVMAKGASIAECIAAMEGALATELDGQEGCALDGNAGIHNEA